MTDAHPRLTEPLFYCATLEAQGDVTLTGAEARHVAVQRLRVGDAIAVFDGRGQVARGRIQTVGRDDVRIAVEQRHQASPPTPRLELYSAVPKGDRLAIMLDMATQLGMNRFVPLRWNRSVTEPRARTQDRWQRICIEACKQSRRVHVPIIEPVVSVEEAALQAKASASCLVVAHPATGARPVHAINLAGAARIALFIGPEGGLTDDEANVLQDAGGHFVNLGAGILRIETAAVCLLSALAALLTRNERVDL